MEHSCHLQKKPADPPSNASLKTLKSFLGPVVLDIGEGETKKFLRSLTQEYHKLLPKILKELYLHLDIDLPSCLKNHRTPKRRTPKRKQEVPIPSDQLKKRKPRRKSPKPKLSLIRKSSLRAHRKSSLR